MSEYFYLGPEGTFSHILARKRFGVRASLHPCPTIDAIFDAVAATPGSVGLIPIENSSGGTVYDSVDSLIQGAGKIFLQEELALNVRIALLGHPGQPVKQVFSHFIQLKHHAEWLRERYPKARVKAVSSTAVAAQKAAASKTAAALASPGAAEVYGLDLIEQPPSLEEVNVTHFFTISSQPSEKSGEVRKTSFIAALPNACGSLHSFLGPFARQKVSLTRIVSRPVRGKPQTYVFFIEIEGGLQDPPVAAAWARASKLAESLTLLGTYPVGRRFNS